MTSRILMAAVLASVLGTASRAEEVKHALNGENTKVKFTGSKSGGSHEGGFEKLSGTATVKDGDATTLALKVEIDTKSLWSDDKKLTGHLASGDFFNVKKHPKAMFVTSKVEKSGKEYKVTGKLTMLGKTNDVSFGATIAAAKGLELKASFKINRSEWGMAYGKGKINDEVEISVAVNAK